MTAIKEVRVECLAIYLHYEVLQLFDFVSTQVCVQYVLGKRIVTAVVIRVRCFTKMHTEIVSIDFLAFNNRFQYCQIPICAVSYTHLSP